jgi:uncharacterized protein (DUF697 family)
MAISPIPFASHLVHPVVTAENVHDSNRIFGTVLVCAVTEVICVVHISQFSGGLEDVMALVG